jgi:crotonobetainyl-CoA:carnitine CoA-transferase CaiB-like acyl-CoA transferase
MNPTELDLFYSLTVLSLEQAMALPHLTMRLAQEGMRVIRVEHPTRSDPNRHIGPEVLPVAGDGSSSEQGMNAYFLPYNLGKQAITLNLTDPEGQALLHRLIGELPVDIFATNQRPRSYPKLGIDYDTLSRIRPDLIWVGITGFGPKSDEPAYDPILQARAGFMHLTGEADGTPMVFGLPMVDLGAAEHAYGQVMKALYRRATTGEGSRVDISMYLSATSWMGTPVMLAQSFGERMTRRGNTHPFFAPVAVFPTQDGHLYLAVGSEHQWQALTSIKGFENLSRAEYQINSERIRRQSELLEQLSSITRTQRTEHLLAEFLAAEIPASKVNSIDDVCRDLQQAGQLVKATDAATGVQIYTSPPPVITPHLQQNGMQLTFPPRLGEHNQAVFDELGLDAMELQERGLI